MVNLQARMLLWLSGLLKQDLLLQRFDRLCVDCNAPDPKWASANIGAFVCLKCCGVHKSLGTHISKEICFMLLSNVPLGESFHDCVAPGKRYTFKQVIHQLRVLGRKISTPVMHENNF